MKKLVILTSVLAFGALSSFAQGTINAQNSGTGVNIDIQNPTINGGVAVAIGKASTAAGFAGTGPSTVSLTLYGAAASASLATLESAQSVIATGFNSTSPVVSGTESFGSPYTLPNSPGVFDGSVQDEFIWYGSVTSGGIAYGVWSAEATGITPASGAGLPPAIFGTTAGLINTFTLIPLPEPSTIALGGLGAAALLLFRRRK
jgi:hypothetical protein